MRSLPRKLSGLTIARPSQRHVLTEIWADSCDSSTCVKRCNKRVQVNGQSDLLPDDGHSKLTQVHVVGNFPGCQGTHRRHFRVERLYVITEDNQDN